MAKIVDPDDLTAVVNGSQTTEEVEIQTATKTITLHVAGNLSDTSPGRSSGVTGKALYSFLKEEWKSNTTLNKFRFPIKMIYEASFQLINGWQFSQADSNQSVDLIRDAGFQDTTNDYERACIISLGNMDDSAVDQAYYDQVFGYGDNTTVANFDKTGELNENIVIWNGTNNRRGYVKVYLREEQKTFAEYSLLKEQGLATLKYEAYRLPLSNGGDIKAVDNDIQVGTTGTGSITGVSYAALTIDYLVGQKFVTASSIVSANSGNVVLDDVLQDGAGRWYRCTSAGTIDTTDASDLGTMGGAGTAVFEAYPGERQVGANWYACNRILECSDTTNDARTTEVHSWLQYQLRQNVDINDNVNLDAFGTVYGKIAAPFTYFVGDQMWGYPGVYFDNLNANDNNSVTYQDITVGTFGTGTEGIDWGLDNEYLPAFSTARNNPYYASFNLNFSTNLVAETNADTLYRVYFTNDDAGSNLGYDFDTINAIIVNDKDGNPIQGQIDAATKTFQYDYTNNVQRGGGSGGTDAPITVVFQGLNDSEWNYAQFTIAQAVNQNFACNAGDELNYENPV